MQRSNKLKRRWDAKKNCYLYPRPRGRAPTGMVWQGADGWQHINGQLDEERSNKLKRRWEAEKNCYFYPRPRGRAPTGMVWQGVDGWQHVNGQLDEESIIEEFLQDLVYVRSPTSRSYSPVLALPAP